MWSSSTIMALAVLLGPSAPVSLCGDDQALLVAPPAGWEARSERTALGLVVSLEPAGDSGGPTRAIGLLLPLDRVEVVDLERSLADWVGLLEAFGDPLGKRPLELGHAELPARAVHVTTRKGHLYLAVLDAGGGQLLVATLANLGAAASPSDLAEFRSVLASVDFDPAAACDGSPEPRGVPASPGP